MEIKESYKERLSESGDNSGLIVVISANWMTLGFANAKRNVQAPARDPSENRARAACNFAGPFSCLLPAAPGLGGGGVSAPLAAAESWEDGVVSPAAPALSRAAACPGALSGAQLRPRGHQSLPPLHSLHPILST